MACNRHSEHWETLTQAESLMVEHPDSALNVLQNIDTTMLQSVEDKALYALLYTQAEDKNYIDNADDSIIRIAVDYYKDSDDKYHKMLSYYYSGRIQENAQIYSKAIVNLLKAEEIAKEINDHFYLGLIYRSCSNVYDKIYNNVESLNYAKLSYNSFCQLNRNDYEAWSLWRLGCAYHNINNYIQCISIMQQVADAAQSDKNTSLYVEALRSRALSHLALHEYNEVLSIYDSLKRIDSFQIGIDDYQNLGLAYVGIGNDKNAKHCMNKVIKSDSTLQWLSYEINKQKGDYQNALYALENEHSFQDSILSVSITQGVTEAVEDYRIYEQEIQKVKFHYEKMIMYFIIGIIVVVLSLMSIVLFQRLTSQKKTIEHNMMMAQELKEALSAKEKDVSHLFKNQFETIDKLCHTYYEVQNTFDEKTKIHAEVLSIISCIRKDKQTIAKLEAYVNKYRNNLMLKFHQANSNIVKSESDNLLFLYIVIGFSSRTISALFDETLSVIYNRKARLKKRIQNSDCEFKNEFLECLG